MRYLAALLLLCAFSLQASAQLLQVTMESYVVHDGSISALQGMTTYHVFAVCTNSTDEISAVYGDASIPLSLTSTNGFFQSDFGAPTGWNINTAFFSFSAEVEYDSWITIGVSNSNEVTGQPNTIGIDDAATAFEAGDDFVVNSSNGGSWFTLAGDTQAQAGDDLKVLIAQLTAPSDAVISGQLNIQLFVEQDYSSPQQYQGMPLVEYVCDELLGCIDPDACNWDSEAECPDSSCLYVDECDICGGSGVPEGYCDCEGTLPEPGYTCEGTCMDDADGDGVCDEFEVSGCIDLEACDYDALATDPSECDYSCLISMSLELMGIIDLSTPVGGTSGKAIHLKANASIEDLSAFGIGVANNGGGSDGQEFTFPIMSISSGESVLLVRNPAALGAYFDSCWAEFSYITQASSSIDQNGDDAIELYEFGEVIETFGDPNVDGSGQDWEYLDSWAYKWDGNWIFGGVNCTDGTQTIYESTCVYPLCSSGIGCTDVEACNYAPSAATDDGTCYSADEGYDCDGVCVEDSDGDGVCDPFEIEGCMDETACNYDPAATDANGSCLVHDECGVCGGNGIVEGTCNCEGNIPNPGYNCSGECLSDENQNGICDFLELEALQAELENGAYCGEGTYWDDEAQVCLTIVTCSQDLDGDGTIGVEDLMQLLSSFGTMCEGPETGEFTCGEPMNYHGYDYATVQIGEQCWFAENLRTEQYQNGDSLILASQGGVFCSWLDDYGMTGEYCNVNFDANNFETFGYGYNWHCINASELCPTNWHVSTDSDFQTLEIFIGMDVSEANSFAEACNGRGSGLAGHLMSDEWTASDWPASIPNTGFGMIPTGHGNECEGWIAVLESSYLWTSSSMSDGNGVARKIQYCLDDIGRIHSAHDNWHHVRCVKNE